MSNPPSSLRQEGLVPVFSFAELKCTRLPVQGMRRRQERHLFSKAQKRTNIQVTAHVTLGGTLILFPQGFNRPGAGSSYSIRFLISDTCHSSTPGPWEATGQ